MVQTAKSLLLNALARWPENYALHIANQEISYQNFLNPVLSINNALQSVFDKSAAVGVLAQKSLLGYQCIASAFLSGKTYVPLNAQYPNVRNAEILRQSGVTVLLVDSACEEAAKELHAHPDGVLTLVVLKTGEDEQLSYNLIENTNPATDSSKAQASLFDTAYILFTSGSTGSPKGVPISDENLRAYLTHIDKHYSFTSTDRFSQFFDFTFDLSLHDMLVCWQSGACLCVPSKMNQLMPLQFAAKAKLTVWFSVPSLALTAKDLLRKRFSEFRLDTLRLSFFCGEALPQTLAQEWSQIAPNAPVVNLYGPTEATIAFTAHHYTEQDTQYPVVPIGQPFGSNQTAILDADGKACDQGELCLGGTQVFAGYWKAEGLTKNAFHLSDGVRTTDTPTRWYRTGDVVSTLDNGTLLYHGRNDRQVQVNGFRVELQEVEHALRKLHDTGTLAVIAYPLNAIGEPVGLTVFVSDNFDTDEWLAQCKQRLPSYMVPKYSLSLGEFPYNASGKLDYKKLHQIAADQLADT